MAAQWFEGDDVILRDVLLHRTTRENETVLSSCRRCGCDDADGAVALNIGLFRHIDGYEEFLQQKTKLRRGTWLVLPILGAEVRATVCKYVGWSDSSGTMEQLWQLRWQGDAKVTLTVTAPELFPSLAEDGQLVGWSTSRNAMSRIGDSVMTKTTNQEAEIVAYLAAGDDPAEDPAIWKVRHADDDLEDLEEHEWHALPSACAQDRDGELGGTRSNYIADSPQGQETADIAPNTVQQPTFVGNALGTTAVVSQKLTVAEIIAAETAAIQKQYAERQQARVHSQHRVNELLPNASVGSDELGTASNSDQQAVNQPRSSVSVNDTESSAESTSDDEDHEDGRGVPQYRVAKLVPRPIKLQDQDKDSRPPSHVCTPTFVEVPSGQLNSDELFDEQEEICSNDEHDAIEPHNGSVEGGSCESGARKGHTLARSGTGDGSRKKARRDR